MSTIEFSSSNEASKVHWLPCKIAFDGPARVEEKFEAVPGEGSFLEAHLRGRPLQGCTQALPEGYTGHLLSLKSSDDESARKRWTSAANFSELTYWNHSTAPCRTDAQKRCLDFLQTAVQIHAPVSPEEVREQMKAMAK